MLLSPPCPASPLVDYEGLKVNRYFIIPHPDTSVSIPCAIHPGALEQRYSIKWRQLSPRTLLVDQSYNISKVVAPLHPATYECTVDIEHREGLTVEYDGPILRIETTGETLTATFWGCARNYTTKPHCAIMLPANHTLSGDAYSTIT